MADEPEEVSVPLSWVGYDEMPIAYANQFLIQFLPEQGFVLGIGQASNPPLIGSPEEIRQQAGQIEFVPVRTLVRVAFTERKLRDLIAVLAAHLQKFEQHQSKLDPRTPE